MSTGPEAKVVELILNVGFASLCLVFLKAESISETNHLLLNLSLLTNGASWFMIVSSRPSVALLGSWYLGFSASVIWRVLSTSPPS